MRGKRTPVDLILGLNQWFQEEEYPEPLFVKNFGGIIVRTLGWPLYRSPPRDRKLVGRANGTAVHHHPRIHDAGAVP
jgi:hypothetical protein